MRHSSDNLNRVGTNLTKEQISFIRELKLPSIMAITQASEFDTPFVQTKNDSWEYVRLGLKHICIFDLDEHRNKVLKALSVMYSDAHMAPWGSHSFNRVKRLFRLSDDISFSSFRMFLESRAKANKSDGYFEVKAVVKYLIRMGFPNFDMDDVERLAHLPIPNVNDPFLRYQDVENTMPTHLKSLIVNRLVEFGTVEGLESLSDLELKNLSVLGLAYTIGLRPQQFAMLKGSSVRIIAENHKTSLKRYQVSVPLAKQPEVPSSESQVALSQEVGTIVDEYKKRFGISDDAALFPYDKSEKLPLSKTLHHALNDALLFIQTDETKEHISLNQKLRPIYTLYDFRHNIGHSMAMLNASAEEIAAVLGHSSTVAAQYYIMSTPELALLKH